uniref:Secreted protein n=1 Tax=Mesocestoides corti TaxID=53468 RepID=A0A5K3FQF1_MESCO
MYVIFVKYIHSGSAPMLLTLLSRYAVVDTNNSSLGVICSSHRPQIDQAYEQAGTSKHPRDRLPNSALAQSCQQSHPHKHWFSLILASLPRARQRLPTISSRIRINKSGKKTTSLRQTHLFSLTSSTFRKIYYGSVEVKLG